MEKFLAFTNTAAIALSILNGAGFSLLIAAAVLTRFKVTSSEPA